LPIRDPVNAGGAFLNVLGWRTRGMPTAGTSVCAYWVGQPVLGDLASTRERCPWWSVWPASCVELEPKRWPFVAEGGRWSVQRVLGPGPLRGNGPRRRSA